MVEIVSAVKFHFRREPAYVALGVNPLKQEARWIAVTQRPALMKVYLFEPYVKTVPHLIDEWQRGIPLGRLL